MSTIALATKRIALATHKLGPQPTHANFAFTELDEATVRWLRDRLRMVRDVVGIDPAFVELRFVFPAGRFYEDPLTPAARAPYQEIFEGDDVPRYAILVQAREFDRDLLTFGLCEIVFKKDGFFWQIRHGAQPSSILVSEGTVAMAWCLLCPEAERSEAFADLIRLAPHQAIDWITAGSMRSHDGAIEVPLPSLSPAMLADLFQHQDPSVRERAFTMLGSRRDSPIRGGCPRR